MINSYVENILSGCRDISFQRVCEVFGSSSEMINDAKKGCGRLSNILDQGYLIPAALCLVENSGCFKRMELSGDADIVFNRVDNKLCKMNSEIINHNILIYEDIFNVLVELNWLLASKCFYEEKRLIGKIGLINPSKRTLWEKKALKYYIYDNIVFLNDRCDQYESAQSLTFQLLPGLHPDSEVRDLYKNGCTAFGFKNLQTDAQTEIIRYRALFYGLTATSVRAYEMRRNPV